MSDNEQTDAAPATPTPTPPKVETVYVKSGLTGADRDKVVLNEYDPAHPLNAEGKPEVWIAGADSPPVRVAKTPAVVQHLRDGELVEVGESDAKAHIDRHKAAMREREKAQLESHPAFTGLAAALRQRGLSIHELMTGEPAMTNAPEPTTTTTTTTTAGAAPAPDATATGMAPESARDATDEATAPADSMPKPPKR